MRFPSDRGGAPDPSRFRVQAPNSVARDILVVALDPQSAGLGPILAKSTWQGALFVGFQDLPASAPGNWPDALARRLPDLLIMVGTVGQTLAQAGAIGASCRKAGVKVSSILLADAGISAKTLSEALLQLRPWSHTLAVLHEDSDLCDTLRALGA